MPIWHYFVYIIERVNKLILFKLKLEMFIDMDDI